MAVEKDVARKRRKKRIHQKSRKKSIRRAKLARAAHLKAKAKNKEGKLDQRIAKLVDQGYSRESVAKRLGVTRRRINSALDAMR